jgi:hypothetical protein
VLGNPLHHELAPATSQIFTARESWNTKVTNCQSGVEKEKLNTAQLSLIKK